MHKLVPRYYLKSYSILMFSTECMIDTVYSTVYTHKLQLCVLLLSNISPPCMRMCTSQMVRIREHACAELCLARSHSSNADPTRILRIPWVCIAVEYAYIHKCIYAHAFKILRSRQII